MVGKPAEPAPSAQDSAPAPVNTATPDISAFGRSFDLPPTPAQSAATGQVHVAAPSKSYTDGVSFGASASLPGQMPSPFPPPAGIPTSAGPSKGSPIKLGLANLIKGCSAQDIGIAPDLIPSWVQVSLPHDLIHPQLGSGKVTLTLADIVGGLDPEMRHLIVPAHPSIKVEIPSSEISSATPVEPSSGEVQSPASAPSAGLPAGVPWPFQATTEAPQAAPSFSPPSFSPPPPVAQGLPSSLPSGFSSSPARFPAEPGPPSALPGPPLPRPNGVRVSRQSDKHSQMLLRVLLGSEAEDFDAEAVVKLTTSQPGVAAAVCFHDGRPVATSGNGSPEAENFLRQAQRMHDHVQPLVALTGIEGTETVSVKSDRHMVTFSLQGQVTLGVLHDPLQQEASLREKVTLIARELTGLLHAA